MLGAYLVAWPVPIDPVAWRPAAPPDDPRFAPNGGFRGLRRLGAAEALEPEAVALDPEGRVVTGTSDGRLLRVHPATGAVEELARTGGRRSGSQFANGVAVSGDGTYVLVNETGASPTT